MALDMARHMARNRLRDPGGVLPASADALPLPVRIFCSEAGSGAMAHELGRPHYSYRFVAEAFQALFRQRGVDVTPLAMPEYYASLAALPAGEAAADAAPVHLIFRSTEEIRLLKPAYNIACFAWEFDVLKDSTLPGEHPFLNQKRMLALCDEIWVPSRYTQEVLRRHGLEAVHVVPAPIFLRPQTERDRLMALIYLADIVIAPLLVNFLLPLRLGSQIVAAREARLADWLSTRIARQKQTRIYLAVLNPEDFRKNLDALLRGFHYFSQTHPDCVLLVKLLTARARFPLAEAVADVVRNKLDAGTALENENIAFFNDYLDDAQMGWLYRLADFYLCTSVAEGQNLPLLEAMLHGAVPVSTRNTAMLDYLDAGNSIDIPTRRIAYDTPHLAGCVAGKPFEIDRCGFRDVEHALEQSSQVSPERLQEMAAAGAATVARLYGADAVWQRLGKRLAEIAAQPAADAAA